MKNLVVYYSRSGYNKKIAEELASLSLLKADLDRIVPEKDYLGAIGWLRAGFSALKRKIVKINVSKNPLDYDLVIFGGPNWAGKLSSPLLSYLSNYKPKRAAFFSVSGSGDISKSLLQLKGLGIKPVATLALKENELKENMHHAKVIGFYNHLRQMKQAKRTI